ncbi:MAG: hypothetical protein HUU37_00460 [Bdellovibrionales bacterium]|nr:hypothetical protein [Bdellovibrionales bacterium]
MMIRSIVVFGLIVSSNMVFAGEKEILVDRSTALVERPDHRALLLDRLDAAEPILTVMKESGGSTGGGGGGH